jgi:methylphosphotriester-DNA--protein-cysteine methyltransferase
MTTSIPTKTCAGCREELPLAFYDKDSRASQGVRSRCKRCRAAQGQAKAEGRQTVTEPLAAPEGEPTADAWVDLLWASAAAVAADESATPAQRGRVIASLGTASRHFISVRDEEERLQELESAMAKRLEAARNQVGAGRTFRS